MRTRKKREEEIYPLKRQKKILRNQLRNSKKREKNLLRVNKPFK